MKRLGGSLRKLDAFNTILNTTGLPVRYRIFEEPQNPPYIVYYVEGTNNFGADNTVYSSQKTIILDLFTEYKDEATENELEKIFGDHEIFWTKTEDYIEELHLYMITYELII